MTQHTPGPWHWQEGYLWDASAMPVLYPTHDLRVEGKAADVRLIAAAPDLLAALKDVTERYRRSIILGGTDPEFADIAVAQFQAVIAEAEGSR